MTATPAKKATAKKAAAPAKKAAKSASQSRRGGSRGDLTGKRKVEAQENLTKEQVEEQQRLTTASVEAQKEADETIVDTTGQGVTEEEAAEHGALVIESADTTPDHLQPYDPQEDPSFDVADATGDDGYKEPDLILDPDDDIEIATEAAALPPATEIVIPREDCRFIMGPRQFQFSGGRRYKVDFDVAQHMREKGLIW